jgi:hypothetical protein
MGELLDRQGARFLFVNFKVFDFFVECIAVDAKLNGSLSSCASASS